LGREFKLESIASNKKHRESHIEKKKFNACIGGLEGQYIHSISGRLRGYHTPKVRTPGARRGPLASAECAAIEASIREWVQLKVKENTLDARRGRNSVIALKGKKSITSCIVHNRSSETSTPTL